MKSLACVLFSVMILGCSVTPEEQAELILTKYGPRCVTYGLEENSPKHSECVTALYVKETAERERRTSAVVAIHPQITVDDVDDKNVDDFDEVNRI